jgi:hypothetical protein
MPAWLVVALIATALVWPLRLFGRWLAKKGAQIERGGKDDSR